MSTTPLIFDGHNDLVTVLRNEAGYSVAGLDTVVDWSHTDLVRLRQGGVGAQFWSAWVPPQLSGPEAVLATVEQIDAIKRLVAAYPQELAFARSADDVVRATKNGKIASLIGVEGGHSLANSLAVLRIYAELGVTYLTLTHTANVGWADSGTDEPDVRGLSADGKAIVAELNRLGVLVDLSHTSEATQLAALEASTAPVIFSHSSAYSVNPHPRNVSDQVLEKLATNGGVVLVTFVPDFLSAAHNKWSKRLRAAAREAGVAFDFTSWWANAPAPAQDPRPRHDHTSAYHSFSAEWEARNPAPRVGVEDVVAHLEHVRSVVGIDHVGIGGDYDGVPTQPRGLDDVSGYPNLLRALGERGWSTSDLTKLAGSNVLRVLGDAQRMR